MREALSNVLRHSGADRARIRLGIEPDRGLVEVRIADNGCGFGSSEPGPNHYGQTIMRERADILGGAVLFRKASEGGAEVLLRFTPVHAVLRTVDNQGPGDEIRARSSMT